MNTAEVMTMVFHMLGGLGIFLIGMKNMSEGMQAVAGDRLRHMISAVTNNRLVATGVGTFMTAIMQSSSITTVMVVGFVNSGFMTLTQSLGVIMGANIGTTITGWILALQIGKYGLPILGVAAFFYLFSKRDKFRYVAMAVMGIGMIFFGLELMKLGFRPIRGNPEFKAWFSMFEATSYLGVLKCALAGCVLTAIVQSSSATLGITIGLAMTGVINFQTAAALVLGENIGTTITALLASIGATANARRAAYFHMIFNVIGVFWITLLFLPVYLPILRSFLGVDPDTVVMVNGETTFPYITGGIALAHTGFNVANVLLFLPLAGYIAGFLTKVVPERKKEVPHLTQLDIRFLESPVIGIEQSHVELLRMSDSVNKMMVWMKTILTADDPDEAVIKKVFHREEVLDIMQKEITVFLSGFLSGSIPHSYVDEGRLQLRMADEYESVSDYVVNILKAYMRMKNENLRLVPEDLSEILNLHDTVSGYVNMVGTALVERNTDIISKAHSQGEAIAHKLRELRHRYIAHLTEVKVDPLVSSSYSDMLNSYRRVKDHTLNIAEALAGEK